MRLFMVSGDPHKLEETRSLLGAHGVEVCGIQRAIEEVQTHSLPRLVRQKTLDAFRQVRRPVLVEHTALYVRCLNGLPGGFTQTFWKALGPERFLRLFADQEEKRLFACSMMGYCDGRTIVHAKGVVRGLMAPEARGPATFGWDCVFVPEGHDQTFAEMGPDRKGEISMRRKALDALVEKMRRSWNL